ncbi:MAG TPA: NAD(P)-dependent oxidoreductase, partial [Caldilineaceae bacterium]|nr:NAD(P)-dependent oxidoreductase [Caldilineaceae bacterium]
MSEPTKKRVLVTGMSGLIGSALYRELGDRYVWRALNRRPMPGVETRQADIGDLAAIRPAFDGVDVVVHLAANARVSAPWEEVLHHNVIGTYNVFEAARQAGVSRVVFASSGATVSGVQREEPYKALVEGRYSDVEESWPMLTHRSMVRPTGLYGVSKVWGEVLARHFVDISPLSILCLRIGYVNREDRPTEPAHFANWCSQRDIVQAIQRAIEAP